MTVMERKPTVQDISWLLDLVGRHQLRLDPPFQRKSVWTTKDRKYFVDTILRNYPCPSIFIHKEMSDDGLATYNVVDGKQRLETIIQFSENKIAIDDVYGDEAYAGKTFGELTIEQKRNFWNYPLVIDFVRSSDTEHIRKLFDRLNRNHKNLNRQELRHAKYTGWFVREAEREAERSFWELIKVNTKSKSTRMRDVQIVSELLIVLLKNEIVGFKQDHIDQIYADYDDDNTIEFDEDFYLVEKERVVEYLRCVVDDNTNIQKWLTTANNLYTLWALVALHPSDLPDPDKLAKKYASFMNDVTAAEKGNAPDMPTTEQVNTYIVNSHGANTDLKQRLARLDSLRRALLNDESN